LNNQITVSGNSERNPAEYLNDHNTYTTRKLQPELITLQLEQASVIKKIKLYLQKGQAVLVFSAWVDGKEEPFGEKIDLTTVNNGWYTVAVPELATDKIQISICDAAGQTGGIGEIEIWGEADATDDQTIPLGENLTGVREFGLQLDDIDGSNEIDLWLVLPTRASDWQPRLNINGTSVAAFPVTMNCNGVTLAKVNCDRNLLKRLLPIQIRRLLLLERG
jgi:hypothetical protein